ncbi:MAG: NAD(P)-dependent glycerol-3-phosphate dehydrogenase [Micavibrio aeruginosavorus]|nr:NAD(P)-dependent glycerol-3-phosphate dehydrogenase [Micavibrio aeruginosavorus]
MTTISVIGAGAWGTALAQSFSRGGRDVILWARDPGLADTINQKHINTAYLPHQPLHHDLKATSDLEAVCAADILVPVIPAQYLRAMLTQISAQIAPGKPLVVCAKGIEMNSGKLMTQVAGEAVPHGLIAILSGPNFAHEVAKGLPAAATLACADMQKALPLRDALSSKSFRLYLTDDLIGTQIGGAVKNVIAIVCGIVAGRHMGENARAAVMTRGLHEMARLATAMGGDRETLMGLSGIGDLILTCSSMQSRNFSLGHALGQGKSLQDILAERHDVTEGIPTAEALVALAAAHKIDMPIVEALHDCLKGNTNIDAAIHRLMDRPLQMENS